MNVPKLVRVMLLQRMSRGRKPLLIASLNLLSILHVSSLKVEKLTNNRPEQRAAVELRLLPQVFL